VKIHIGEIIEDLPYGRFFSISKFGLHK
jgi:hypothetical protein